MRLQSLGLRWGRVAQHGHRWAVRAHFDTDQRTSAGRLLVEYARSIAVDRLEAHVAEDNVASRRVAEKAGFELVGRFVDEGTPMVRYQLGLRMTRCSAS